MAAPDKKEIELIEKFRENLLNLDLCDEALSDVNLVRWLRARNHVLKDAETMFRDYLKWFDEVDLESIFKHEIPEEVSDIFKQPICGLDYDGCPITLLSFGQINLVKLMKEHKELTNLYGIQVLERNSHLVREMMTRQNNDKFIQISTIADGEGLCWSHFTSADAIQCIVTHSSTFEAYYPETASKIIVINAPRAFTLLWNIVKPFVSQKTLEKFQIYGKDRVQWQEAIFKLAPKESLPKKYGGILPDDVDILPKCHECVPKKRGSY